MSGGDLVVQVLAGQHTGLAGLHLRGRQFPFGLRPAGQCLGFQLAGLGQGLGAPPEGLAPPGDVLVGQEPSGDPIERAEEPLEAQPKGCPVFPVAVMRS